MEEISNKTKVILIVLAMIPIIIVTFFASLIVVNAETNYNQSITLSYSETSSNVDRILYNDPNHTNKAFSNTGRGYLVGIISSYRYGTGVSFEIPTIYSINARTDSGYSTCEVSSLSNDMNDNTQMKANMYGFKCDLTMGENGLISLSVNFRPQVNNSWTVESYRLNFNNNLQAQEVQYSQYLYDYMQNYVYPRLNGIENNTGATSQELQWIYQYLQNYIYTALNGTSAAINNQTQQQQQNHDELMDEDIDSTSKQNVDETKYNDYKQKEDTLMQTGNNADLSGLSIGIDTGTSETIWQLITRIIQSNAKVFGLFISILSIGIIKLALAR